MMKIASITVFCNERFRLDDWMRYYQEYAPAIGLHVIVNNGDPADTPTLRTLFPHSLVLESSSRNLLAAYNLGLREILRDPEVRAVLQLVNDVRISAEGLTALGKLLEREPDVAMVSPVLLEKDSDVIDCFGCEIDRKNLDFIHLDCGKHLADIAGGERRVTGLPAGIVLARRDVYERLGFQDERLGMYADEVDLGLRMADAGYALVATSAAVAWHQHVFPGGKQVRNARAAFLMSRNPLLIARKRGDISVSRVFFRRVEVGIREMLSALLHGKSFDVYRFGFAEIRGAFAGLFESLRPASKASE